MGFGRAARPCVVRIRLFSSLSTRKTGRCAPPRSFVYHLFIPCNSLFKSLFTVILTNESMTEKKLDKSVSASFSEFVQLFHKK